MSAQTQFARKALALKRAGAPKSDTPPAAVEKNRQDRAKAALAPEADADRADAEARAHSPRAPPFGVLLSKREVLAVVGVTYPTLWAWMRAGTFPRSRVVGGKSKWLSTEIEAWMTDLPVRRLKGDNHPSIEEKSPA
jgi:predicted DNA-binding transcriptional regulator AlpA